MDFIGYIVDAQNLAHALTYGPQTDMEAWVDLNRVNNPTSALYQAKAGDDVPRCLIDDAYFQSLLP